MAVALYVMNDDGYQNLFAFEGKPMPEDLFNTIVEHAYLPCEIERAYSGDFSKDEKDAYEKACDDAHDKMWKDV